MKRLLFLLMAALLLAACGNDTPKEEPEKETPVVEEEAPEQDEVKEEPAEEPVVEEEPNKEEVEDDLTWDDLKEQDKIVGKSDKDYTEVTKSKPRDVRNDKTGKWKITTISENVDIEKYALSYADLYMNDGEVHYIVNFNNHTTTWLNEMDDLLYVDVREYEKKEEHDAKTLGNGMVLKSYVIYPDGDIQELDGL